MRLTQTPEDSILSPIPAVDEFGQWIPTDWTGKKKTLEELKTAWAEEERELENASGFNVSEFGGYLDTKYKATGFFRVEKIDGRWWFVDPEGHLFFSLGSTGIRADDSFSRVDGREYVYQSFPPSDFVGSDNKIRKSSFFIWNLYRRFGEDWYKKWMETTSKRMDSWGLNTVANWSDTDLAKEQKKVYVATLRGWELDPNTMGMPDVYDPGYRALVDSAARKQCVPLKNDPYLLGYFIGNEPPWPGREQELAKVILDGKDTPMKAALRKYLAEGDTPERRKAFVYETYDKFVRIVNSSIKKHDPNHLNLGLRFGGRPPEDLVKATSASAGFDVFSINIYGYSAYKETLQVIDKLTGLPIIIGEFHFGTPGKGLAPGLAQTKDQTERGAAYRYYVENAAAHPSLIGTHWFQWCDQPSTGRGDGENYNIGFVDVTDQPYRELVNAAIETHKRIKDIHAGSEPPVSRQAQRQ
jgi:hypothetical protein